MNRRNFLKLMAATTAVGLSPDALKLADARAPQKEEIVKIRSACRNCYGKCGIEGTIQNGRVAKIEGVDELFSEGSLCAKAFAIPQLMYSPLRLHYPLLRAGQRGDGRWKRISWEDAMNLITQKYSEITNKHGSGALTYQCGTRRDLTTSNIANRLFSKLGAVNALAGDNTSDFVSHLIYGDETQHTGWDCNYAKCIILWSRQERSYGYYDTLIIERAQARGVKVIAVDPRYTATASKADVWLPIRVGSDMALALAFLHQIIASDRYDRSFIKKWTSGPFLVKEDGTFLRENDIKQGGSSARCAYWDENINTVKFWDEKALHWDSENPEPAILGTHNVAGKTYKTAFQIFIESVQEWTPKKAAEITRVPEHKIKEAARLYIENSPEAAFTCGQNIERNTNSSGISHAFAIMMALTGNFDVRGGQNIARQPANGLDIRVTNTAPTARNAPLQTKGYFGMASQPILAPTGGEDIIDELNALEFSVNVDFFMTPTGEYCDIVLPAAHPNEVDRIEWAHLGHGYPASHTALIRQAFSKPLGESHDDVDILFDLAKRMNVNIGWKDKYEFYDAMLHPVQMNFEQFREKKFLTSTAEYKRFETGKLRHDKLLGFETDNAKFNIYSEDMMKYGWNAVPFYKEPPTTSVSRPDLLEEYPYTVITGGRAHMYFNTEYRQSPWLREQHAFPTVQINPETAKKHDIQNGDWVYIETNIGRCKQHAELTNAVHPHVVHLEHGWWFPEKYSDEDLHGAFECNPNALFSKIGNDNICGLCKIYKALDGMPKNIYTTLEQLEAFLPKQP